MGTWAPAVYTVGEVTVVLSFIVQVTLRKPWPMNGPVTVFRMFAPSYQLCPLPSKALKLFTVLAPTTTWSLSMVHGARVVAWAAEAPTAVAADTAMRLM